MSRFALCTRENPEKVQRDVTEKKIHSKMTSENLPAQNRQRPPPGCRGASPSHGWTDDQKPQEGDPGARWVQTHPREAYKHREPRLTERNAFTSQSSTHKALSKVSSDSASSDRVCHRLITPSCPFYFMPLFVKLPGHSSPC